MEWPIYTARRTLHCLSVQYYANVDPDLCRDMASLWQNQLIQVIREAMKLIWCPCVSDMFACNTQNIMGKHGQDFKLKMVGGHYWVLYGYLKANQSWNIKYSTHHSKLSSSHAAWCITTWPSVMWTEIFCTPPLQLVTHLSCPLNFTLFECVILRRDPVIAWPIQSKVLEIDIYRYLEIDPHEWNNHTGWRQADIWSHPGL